MSRCTSSGRGIVVMPRDQASWSKDSRVIPCPSYCRAIVDLPDPAGPHMKMTRPTSVTLSALTRVSRFWVGARVGGEPLGGGPQGGGPQGGGPQGGGGGGGGVDERLAAREQYRRVRFLLLSG
jgi:hypothetical protein